MAVQIQFRHDAEATWAANNPVLAVGEMGVETDTKRFKVGDGSTAWNSLPYSSGVPGPTGPTGPQGDSVTGPMGPTGPTGPAADLTGYVTLTGSQTLTNKTLTSPVLTTPTFGSIATTGVTGTGQIVLDNTPSFPFNISTPAVNAASASGALAIGGNVTTGMVTVGAAETSGSVSIANGTTFAGTVNLASGAISAGTRTVNIGTSQGSGGTTNIAIGSAAGTSSTTLQGTTYLRGNLDAWDGSASQTIFGNLSGSAGTISIANGSGFQGTLNLASGTGGNGNTRTVNIHAGNYVGTGVKIVNIGTSAAGGTTTVTIGTSSGGTSRVIINATAPTSATDTGSAGQIAWDSSYFYVCVAGNTWKRTALSTW